MGQGETPPRACLVSWISVGARKDQEPGQGPVSLRLTYMQVQLSLRYRLVEQKAEEKADGVDEYVMA